jgi:hypothetical protein
MRKIILAGISLLTICVGLRWYSASLFSTDHHRCWQSGTIADGYFHSIDTVLGQLLHDKVSASSIIAQLQKQFPELKKIIISYRPTGVQVNVSAHNPVCCINDSSILTPEGELFPKNSFSQDTLTTIPHMRVAEKWMAHAPSSLLSLLQELPSDFDQYYNLEVINEHYVRLVDKDKPQFTIVFSAAQKEIPKLLAHCQTVKHTLDAQKSFNKGTTWAADTRFADYIVLYKT